MEFAVSEAGESEVFDRSSGTEVVGVCISASILIFDTDFVRETASVTSLLADREHEKVSPT